MFLGNVAASILLPSKSCTRSARYQRDEPSTQGRCSRGQLARGVLTDARGERFTPSHAVKKGRRYRYYVSAALITQTGADAGPGNRRRCDQGPDRRADQPGDAARALRYSRHTERPNPENARSCNPLCRGPQSLLSGTSQGRSRPHRESRDRRDYNHDQGSARPILGPAGIIILIGEPERQPHRAYGACRLQAPRCRNEGGAPGSGNTERPLQNDRSRCDPTLIKAIARGRAWFEELAARRARTLRELAERDGITRRYVRRLVDLAFLSPELVDAILQAGNPSNSPRRVLPNSICRSTGPISAAS